MDKKKAAIETALRESFPADHDEHFIKGEHQRAIILDALATGPKHSEQLRALGIVKPEARISELRNKHGCDIRSCGFVKAYDSYGVAHRYMQYERLPDDPLARILAADPHMQELDAIIRVIARLKKVVKRPMPALEALIQGVCDYLSQAKADGQARAMAAVTL